MSRVELPKERISRVMGVERKRLKLRVVDDHVGAKACEPGRDIRQLRGERYGSSFYFEFCSYPNNRTSPSPLE